MSTTSTARIYYLTPPAPSPAPPLSPLRRIRLRARILVWRLRLTAVELASVLRRFGRVELDADAVELEQRANLILAAARITAGPARVIDFAAARTRLRA